MNPFLLPCVFTLMGTALLNIVLRSLQVSREAGLLRLEERFPGRANSIRRWTPHLPSIYSSLVFLAGVAQISSVWLAVEVHDILRADQGTQLAWIWVSGFTLLFILLLRVLPMVASTHYADRITLIALPLAGPISRLLFPIAWLMATLQHHLDSRLAPEPGEDHSPSAEDEILTLMEQNSKDGLDDDEKEIIRSVLEFGDTITREIMTPRVNMVGVEDDLNVREAVAVIMDSPFSRFPVFHEDYDEILGMLHAKDLLKAMARDEEERQVTEFMHPPIFVPESMPINDLLQQMKQQKLQTAIAVDEYGGTAGIITLEDIIEELVGEIEDEHDREEQAILKASDGSYLVNPGIPVDEINEELELGIPESDNYDSVGGYLLFCLGRIPAQGDQLQAHPVEFTIEEATPRRIEKIRVRRLPEPV